MTLSEAQQRVVETMRRDGIGIVSFHELFGDAELWERLAADIGSFARETEQHLDELRQRQTGKTFIARRFYVPRSEEKWTFPSDDLWLRYAIAPEIVDVVNAYRGQQTYLIDLDNWYTIPEPEAEQRVKSQQWHRDPWDNHIVKVFTYFSDVDEQAGPFEYVVGSPAGGPYGHLWPWEGKGIYPPQDEFEQAIPAEARLTATGPAGTIIFCDTSGFHRGGWAKTKPRVLSYHAHVSPASTKAPRLRVDWAGGDEGLTPQARFAVSWSLDGEFAVS